MAVGALGVISAIGSAVVGGVGAVMQANAASAAAQSQAQMAQYQAAVAEMNKRIADDNAKRSIERAQVEQQDQDAVTAAFLGEQIAAQGASGLSLHGRSAAMTRKAGAQLGRRDALNIRQAGELEAYDHRTQGVNFGAQADLFRMQAGLYQQQASSARTAGMVGMLGSVFGGMTSLASQARPNMLQRRFA